VSINVNTAVKYKMFGLDMVNLSGGKKRLMICRFCKKQYEDDAIGDTIMPFYPPTPDGEGCCVKEEVINCEIRVLFSKLYTILYAIQQGVPFEDLDLPSKEDVEDALGDTVDDTVYKLFTTFIAGYLEGGENDYQ
jgi:hypothetical protein